MTTQSSHRRLWTVTRRIGAGASLAALLVAVLCLATLAAGCGQARPVNPSASSAPGTTVAPSDTSTTAVSTTAAGRLSSPLAGRWFFSDASGGVAIEPGAKVSFLDPDGGVLAGPFAAMNNGGSLLLTLSADDLAEVFGEDPGVGDVDFAFRAGATEDELLAEMETSGGEQSSMTLTRAPQGTVPSVPPSYPTTTPPTEPPDPDAALEQVVVRLVTGLLDCRRDLGYSPQAQDLAPGGMVEPYIPGGWPTNPFTGEPVQNLAINDPGDRKPGAIFYMYFGGETFVDYWTSDGVQRQMHVDW